MLSVKLARNLHMCCFFGTVLFRPKFHSRNLDELHRAGWAGDDGSLLAVQADFETGFCVFCANEERAHTQHFAPAEPNSVRPAHGVEADEAQVTLEPRAAA